jgi:hypothetical protein
VIVRETVRASRRAPAECWVSPIWVISKISQVGYTVRARLSPRRRNLQELDARLLVIHHGG